MNEWVSDDDNEREWVLLIYVIWLERVREKRDGGEESMWVFPIVNMLYKL